MSNIVIVNDVFHSRAESQKSASEEMGIQLCWLHFAVSNSNVCTDDSKVADIRPFTRPRCVQNSTNATVMEAVGYVYSIYQGVRPKLHRHCRCVKHTAYHIPKRLVRAFRGTVLRRCIRGRLLKDELILGHQSVGDNLGAHGGERSAIEIELTEQGGMSRERRMDARRLEKVEGQRYLRELTIPFGEREFGVNSAVNGEKN